MNSDEIKQSISMPDILAQYGIPVRRNMCKCPFHGVDKHPSMKVFKDGLNCFTCGWRGDVFDFVMAMDRCDFKTAFKALGGTYEKVKSKSDKAKRMARIESKKDERKRSEKTEDKVFNELSAAIRICEIASNIYEVYSDEWCLAVNSLQSLEYIYESKYINNEEVEDLYVYRKCREIRRRFL